MTASLFRATDEPGDVRTSEWRRLPILTREKCHGVPRGLVTAGLDEGWGAGSNLRPEGGPKCILVDAGGLAVIAGATGGSRPSRPMGLASVPMPQVCEMQSWRRLRGRRHCARGHCLEAEDAGRLAWGPLPLPMPRRRPSRKHGGHRRRVATAARPYRLAPNCSSRRPSSQRPSDRWRTDRCDIISMRPHCRTSRTTAVTSKDMDATQCLPSRRANATQHGMLRTYWDHAFVVQTWYRGTV